MSYRSIPELVAERAVNTPDRIFLREVTGRTRTWMEVNRESARWGRALAARGVDRGSAVLMMVESSVDAIEAWLGVALLGARETAINVDLRGRSLRYVVEDSGAEIVVAERKFVHEVLAVAQQSDITIRHIVIIEGDPGPGRPEGDLPGWSSPIGTEVDTADDFLRQYGGEGEQKSTQEIAELLGEHSTAAMLYTSGTTGPSKGVLVPWAQLHATAEGSFPVEDLEQEDVFYAAYPFYHVLLKGMLHLMCLVGGQMVIRRRFSTSEFWPDVRRFGCTTTVLLSAMATFLEKAPHASSDSDNPLKNVNMLPLRPGYSLFAQRFGVRICTNYNMTELSVPISSQGWQLDGSLSCGRLRDGYEVRLVDELDYDVPEGQPGELIVRSRDPWVTMTGYWNKPEATCEAWRNQWMHTGDILRRDEQGNFFFLDRKKDAIRRRGENISSAEVEAEVMDHPDVLECAAVAVPAEESEDEVMVVVVPKPGRGIDPLDLATFLSRRMPRFMQPRFIRVMDRLPRTGTHKVRKVELRQLASDDSVWDRAQSPLMTAR